ncbi:unnamed protein product [Phytophthora fragariaefolia]|uniref:Unnamed protein product n=1 Tax=Phytophthora fragariaefolia TaxID=1490495 RepID=A0A9W7CWD1_9STRA|nr:unnamed protein product [Phytophthora fragariaefolia]
MLDYVVPVVDADQIMHQDVAGRSGAPRPITRNLAGEFDEVAKPEPACDDSGSENEVSDKKTTDDTVIRKLPGHRPPMNSSTPVANRVIGRILDQMMEPSDWIRQFTPKAVRQPLWVELSGELAWPVNTMSTVKVAEDTVSLLRAMGLEPQTNPSEAAPGTGTQQLLISLPQTPKKSEHGKENDDDGVFGVKTEGTPYFEDSHMMTPRSSNRPDRLGRGTEASNAQRGDARASSGRSHRRFVPRDDSSDDNSGEDEYYRKEGAEYDDPSDELARQVKEVSEMERLNSTPKLELELATHRPLAQIKAFSGLRNKSENSMQWLRTFVYEMKGARNPPNEGCMAFELSLRDGALHCPRESKYERSERLNPRDVRRSFEDSSSEDVEDRSTDDDQSGSDYADPYHSDEHDRHIAAANDSERQTEAIGMYGRSENRGRRGYFPNGGLDRNSRHQGPDRQKKRMKRTMEIEKKRNGSFGGSEIDGRRYDEWNDGSSEGMVSSVAQKTWHDYQPENVIKLLSGERHGWWSAQKLDKRVRMRALVQGAVNDARTRILFDAEANVSVISECFAKQLRMREVRDHERCMEIQGFTQGTMATIKRTLAKVTLGWNQVYEYELWVMDHGAGVDVVLGTDFMIPAGVRLDLFHATARFPDEVEMPLIKTQRMADTREEGPHIPDGPTEV